MPTVKLGIKNHEGKYLLIRREDKDGLQNPGLWDVVGGAVNQWESPYEAVLRESEEETGGIELSEVRYLGPVFIDEKIKGVRQKTQFLLYLAKTPARIEDVRTEFGQEAGFFTLDEVLERDTIPNLKELLLFYRGMLESY